MATPTATLPSAYVPKVTVVPPAGQNPPPSFIELASGKMLFFYSTGASHLSTDGNLMMKTAASEEAANAGQFTAPVALRTTIPATGSVNPPRGDYTNTGLYFGGGYASQQQEGANKGRVWLISGSGTDLPEHDREWNTWRAWICYTDNPDDDVITWSPFVELPNLFSGFGIDSNISGMGINHPMIERPGTNGQEWVLAVLGFDTNEKYEYTKLIGTTTGPLGTWSARSTVVTPGGPTATYSPSEPVANIIYTSSAAPKLAVGINMFPTEVTWKTSDDWGFTWNQGFIGGGVTIANNATAPPAFVQCTDESIVCFYRNLADSEHTWMARSTDYGATWPQKWLLDANGRMRYGNFAILQSLRVGLCYGTETLVFPSTEAGIYWQPFTIAPPTGGSAPSASGPSLTRIDADSAQFSAQMTPGGMHAWHRTEYGQNVPLPSATAITPSGARRIVQSPDFQNAPPAFVELASGKMLFVYSPAATHASQDGSLVMKTATSEAAANAGTFSAATTIVAKGSGNFSGYQVGGLCQVKEGPNKGRVWMTYTRFSPEGVWPRTWTTGARYTDNPDAATPTWSVEVAIPSVFSGTAVPPGAALIGMSTVTKMVEVPGSRGQEWVMPVLGFTGGQPYESIKLIASENGGMSWTERSVIHGPQSTTAPSEPVADVVYAPDGSARLLVGVNWWNSSGSTNLYVKWSDDWGHTWKRTVNGAVETTPGAGTTVATNATAPPYFAQASDGSLFMFYRNLSDSERTWTQRSTDVGATWGQAAQLDSEARRSRYGQVQSLASGKIGICYGTETMDFPSAQAGIYWQPFTVAAPSGYGGLDRRTPWTLKPPLSAFQYGINEELDINKEPMKARLSAKNLVGTSNSSEATLSIPSEAVGRSLDQPYLVRNSVGRSLSQLYAMIAAVGKSLGQPYKVGLDPVAKSLVQPYNLVTTISKILTISYTIGRTVGRSLEFRYGVPTITTGYQTDRRIGPVQTEYETLRQVAVGDSFAVGKSLPAPYDISPPVQKSLQMPYKVSVVTSKSLEMPYPIRTFAGRSLEMGYRFSVGRSLDQEYQIITHIGRSLPLPFNMTGPIGRSLDMAYQLGRERTTSHNEFVRGRQTLSKTGRET